MPSAAPCRSDSGNKPLQTACVNYVWNLLRGRASRAPETDRRNAGSGLPAFFRLFVEIPVADFCRALAGPAFSGSFAVAAYAGPFAVGALFSIGAGLDVFFVDIWSNGFSGAFSIAEAAFLCSAAIGAGAVASSAERAFLFVVSRGAFFHPRT
jgi:hypothetical protein